MQRKLSWIPILLEYRNCLKKAEIPIPEYEAHHEKMGFSTKLAKLSYGYDSKVHDLKFITL